MTSPTPSVIDPKTTMKTHVSELTPAQRLAAHDAAAREKNAGLATPEPVAPEPVELTFENLCGVVLDVVKDFANQGYHPSTVLKEHVVEKAIQRFPDGVKLIGSDVEVDLDEPEADPLRLDRVKGSEDQGEAREDASGALMEPEDDEPAGDGLTEGGSPIGSPEAAEEVSAANEALKAHDAAAKKAAKKKTAAKKKAPTRKPKGPSVSP